MLWLIIGDSSHEIIACNIFETPKGKHQLWVERANRKSLLVVESDDREEVTEVKEAIDYAIRNGHKTLEVQWNDESA